MTLTVLAIIADIIGIIGAVYAAIAAVNARKLRQEVNAERQRLAEPINIKLELTDGTRSFSLPVDITRGELSRAELQGRLGNIPRKQNTPRFNLEYVNSDEYLRQISRIKEGSGKQHFVIPCSEEEFDQFKVQPTA